MNRARPWQPGGVTRRTVPTAAVTAAAADLAGVAGVLARSASWRILGIGVASGVLLRTSRRRPVGGADVVAASAVALAWPGVEWAVHRHVLHAPVRTVAGRRIDLAPGHRAHHADPGDLTRATLPGPAALADTLLLAGMAAALTAAVTRSWRAPAVATAGTAAVAALLRYEWVHLVLHAGRRPRSPRLRRLRVHHRLHHRLHHHHAAAGDGTAGFGVTTTVVDRLAGTDHRRGRATPAVSSVAPPASSR